MKEFYRATPIRLSEFENESVPNRVQLMRTCTFYHKQYGKVEITRQLFSEMIENFKNKTRGIDVMIDYAHDSDREAAAWIKAIEIVDNIELGEAELWADVDWTPKGRKTLSDKEFAYLSADFDPEYKDNENPERSFGAVLLGAGLTNRPVIKKMKAAIQLSEFKETNKENDMSKELEIKLAEVEENLKTANGEIEEKKVELSDAEKKLAEIDTLMQELGVDSIEDLMNKIREMKTDNVELAEAKEKEEKENKLNVLLSEGKISQAQKVKALELEKSAFTGFIQLAEMNEKVVKLAEEGSSSTPKVDANEDVQDKVMELAEKEIEKNKNLNFSDAVSIVLSENKELKEKYYKLGNE